MSNVPPSPPASTQRLVKWTVFLGATAMVVYLCLRVLWPFLNVLAWSGVLAVTFYPVHRFLVRKTGRVALSAFLASTLVVIAFVIPLLFVAALAINQLVALAESLQRAFAADGGAGLLEPMRRGYEWITARLGLDTAEMADWFTQHAAELARTAGGYTLAIAASVTRAIVSFVFVMFAMFLLFRDGERLVAGIPDLLPFERSRSEALLARIREVIYGGVYGVVVIALIQGALCGWMFWILGIPSAALWAMVTVVTSVIPLAGAAAVWVPGAIYLAVTGQWVRAIVLAAWGAAVISAVDNFLRPRLVGGRVGLSELVMFFALLGGLQAFGILGIVVGPVLFAIAGSILDVLRDTREAPDRSA